MFISTLGKDPSPGHVFDDVYGDLIQDILEEDTVTDKGTSDDTGEKVEFDLGRVLNMRFRHFCNFSVTYIKSSSCCRLRFLPLLPLSQQKSFWDLLKWFLRNHVNQSV